MLQGGSMDDGIYAAHSPVQAISIPYVTDKETKAGIGELLLHLVLFELVPTEDNQPAGRTGSEEHLSTLFPKRPCATGD